MQVGHFAPLPGVTGDRDRVSEVVEAVAVAEAGTGHRTVAESTSGFYRSVGATRYIREGEALAAVQAQSESA